MLTSFLIGIFGLNNWIFEKAVMIQSANREQETAFCFNMSLKSSSSIATDHELSKECVTHHWQQPPDRLNIMLRPSRGDLVHKWSQHLK